MFNRCCHILLTEDDPDDSLLFRQFLERSQSKFLAEGFDLNCFTTLQETCDYLDQDNDADILFLDLMLPDSRGIETLSQVRQMAPHLPIVVQTMLEDETIAVQSLQGGASGYLPKSAMDSKLLVYAIRAAIERQQQIASFAENPEQNLAALNLIMNRHDRNADHDRDEVEFYKLDLLSKRLPDIFAELVQRYDELVNQALDQQIYKTKNSLSKEISILSERLGYLQAAPRDVIEIHTTVLKNKTDNMSRLESRAYHTESQFLLIELMGDLIFYYRKYMVGLNKLNLSTG